MKMLRRFVAIFALLAGLAGAALGFDAVKALWIFWTVLGVSALIAILFGIPKRAVDRILDIVQRIRLYGTVLTQLATAQEHEAELEGQLVMLTDHAESEYNTGLQEGRRQVIGALLASNVPTPPKPTGLSASGDDVLVIADYVPGNEPPVGARFELQVRGTGQVKGVLEVVELNEHEGCAILKCVDPCDPDYWEQLASRATGDFSAPSGVVLSWFHVEEFDLPKSHIPPAESVEERP